MANLRVGDIVKETILIILSALSVLLYPLLLPFLLIILIYRWLIQQVVKRDPKVVRILSGMDAIIAAHETYSTKMILIPVYFLTSKVDDKQIVKVLNEKIFKPKGTDQCLYPELSQKIVRKWGYNWWYCVDNFRVEDHIRHLDERNSNDKPLGMEELKPILSEKLLKLPFNPERSPWEIIVVNNYVDDKDPAVKAIIMFRWHHCLCDGYSIAKYMKTVATRPWKESRGVINSAPHKSKLSAAISRILKCSLILLTLPYHSLKMMYFTNDKNDWAKRAVDEYADSVRAQEVELLSMNLIKDLKNKLKVSFSSVVIGLTTEAIVRTLARAKITNVDRFHIMLPFPLPDHPVGRLTNHWSAAKLPINVCKDDPLKTIQNIDEEFKKLRYSVAPLVGFYCSKVMGLLPIPMILKQDDVLRSTCMLTNFPGPSHEVDMFGYNVRGIGTAGRSPKGFAFLVGCLSYNGNLRITTSGEICNFKEQEDIDFFSSSYHDAITLLRGDKEDKIMIE